MPRSMTLLAAMAGLVLGLPAAAQDDPTTELEDIVARLKVSMATRKGWTVTVGSIA